MFYKIRKYASCLDKLHKVHRQKEFVTSQDEMPGLIIFWKIFPTSIADSQRLGRKCQMSRSNFGLSKGAYI